MALHHVYHSSSVSGLSEIKPNPSTHGESWVYATKDLSMSAAFLATLGGDLTCQVGRENGDDGVVAVCERFAGAFMDRYSRKSGSIYVLDGRDFLEDRTGWSEEVVSPHSQKVLQEIPVSAAEQYLLDLEEQGLLKIFRSVHPGFRAGFFGSSRALSSSAPAQSEAGFRDQVAR